jgi:quercetin dioxygenase-like cupin family protein
MNQTTEPHIETADLVAIARDADQRRLAWSAQSEDLNTNLVVLTPGAAVEPHVNREVDVLIVGIDGAGIVIVDGDEQSVRAGEVILIPKGRARATRAGAERFAYLTCHRRRAGLWPTVGGRR